MAPVLSIAVTGVPSAILLAACILHVRRNRTPGAIIALVGILGASAVSLIVLATAFLLPGSGVGDATMGRLLGTARVVGMVFYTAFAVGFLLMALQREKPGQR